MYLTEKIKHLKPPKKKKMLHFLSKTVHRRKQIVKLAAVFLIFLELGKDLKKYILVNGDSKISYQFTKILDVLMI